MRRLVIAALFLLFFSSGPARAQITPDATASGASSSVSTTLTWNHTVGTGANRVLLVGVSLRSDTAGGGAGVSTIVQSVKLGAASLTCVAAVDDNATGSCNTAGSGSPVFLRTEIWSLSGPSSGTAAITVTTNNATTIAGISSSFFNVSSVASGGTNASNNGSTGSTTASLGPVTASFGDVLVDNLATARTSGTDTPTGTGQTNLVASQPQDTASGSFHIHGAGSQETKPAASNPTISWTLTATGPWAEGGALLVPVPRRKGQVIVSSVFDVGSSKTFPRLVETLAE